MHMQACNFGQAGIAAPISPRAILAHVNALGRAAVGAITPGH